MSFTDPMAERLRTGGTGGRRNSYNQAINGQYTPSFNGGSSAVRSSSTRDPYLRDLEKQIEKEEEAKLERRIQEQQDRMKREFDEEQAKKKAKEQAKLKRQEEMARRQQEIQKEAEKQKKEAAERKFQERREQRERRRQGDHHDSDGSTPPPAPVRSNSPPIPAVRRSKGDNSSSE